MKLTNGKETVELNSLGAINGYLKAGYTEVKEEKPKEEKPKAEKKPAKSKQ
jgi:hypothetical protein